MGSITYDISTTNKNQRSPTKGHRHQRLTSTSKDHQLWIGIGRYPTKGYQQKMVIEEVRRRGYPTNNVNEKHQRKVTNYSYE